MTRPAARSRLCGIYAITHRDTGKTYVGQSVDIFLRWNAHTGGKERSAVHRALAKHGVGAFTFRVLELCIRSRLDERECAWIAELGTMSPGGYNLETGGTQRKILAASVRQLLSEKSKAFARENGREATDTEVYQFRHIDGRLVSCTQWDLRRNHMPEYDAGAWCDVVGLTSKQSDVLHGWTLADRYSELSERRAGLFRAHYQHADGRRVHANDGEMIQIHGADNNIKRLRTGKQKKCQGWSLVQEGI